MAFPPTIVWFRSDLRLDDNPALRAAADRGGPTIPVFVWSPGEEGEWSPGAASRWRLHQSLRALAQALDKAGSPLIVRSGSAAVILTELARETGARAAYWNRRYEPAAIEQQRQVEQTLNREGVETESFNASLLVEPEELETQSGGPYRVFTPFWNAWREAAADRPPLAKATKLRPPAPSPQSLKLEDLHLEPKIDWAAGLREFCAPGERGAAQRLRRFLDQAMTDYPRLRDRPDRDGVSGLSPHLHFGEIGPRRIYRAVSEAAGGDRRRSEARGAEAWLRQLCWREFACHMLYHFPHTAERALRERFRAFPWRESASDLKAWQRGQTGYPLVDAGMRQLWRTGWMHNRVRMIVASFLTKDLLLPWQAGARWFWDTLVDADLANNTFGWQWTAGCGADAAPYFRVFNPVLQGRKFDPEGEYVRRWVKELERMPSRYIHEPWAAPESALAAAGVELGATYPRPMIDRKAARDRALAAYAKVREGN